MGASGWSGKRIWVGSVDPGNFLIICIIYNTCGLRATGSKFIAHSMWYPCCNYFSDEDMDNSLSFFHSFSYRDINVRILILLNQ